MTIPYGSTLQGQVEMLIQEFIKQYSLLYLIEINSLPLIIESDIIIDNEVLKENLIHLNDKLKLNESKDFKINIVTELEKEIIENLKVKAFKIIIKLLNEITLELYPNIINFTKLLKNLEITTINLPYYKFSLLYYKTYMEKMSIKKKTYIKIIIDYSKKDKRKTSIASIANICQGMGDAFVMHNFIENSSINFYPVHDAILCKLDDIKLIQVQLLNTYKYVYDYYLNYSDFKNLVINNTEKYELNSLEIFKIK